MRKKFQINYKANFIFIILRDLIYQRRLEKNLKIFYHKEFIFEKVLLVY